MTFMDLLFLVLTTISDLRYPHRTACQGGGTEPTYELTFQHLYLRATLLILCSLKIDIQLNKKPITSSRDGS